MESMDWHVWLLGGLALLHVLLAFISVGHILLTQREPAASILWLICVTAIPVLGPVLYALMGLHRVNKRHQLRGRKRAGIKTRYASLSLSETRRRQYMAEAPANVQLLAHTVGRISGRPLLLGNHVDLLVTGEKAYPSMLDAIANARSSVHLMSYIFDEDETGKQFLDALAAAAARGVETRLLVDAVGAYDTDESFYAAARRAGVTVAEFRPLRLTRWRRGLHFRNHRKILVVDGTTAFTGGMNISDRYLADRSSNPDRCRDFHVRVSGPVVGQFQEVFMEDWYEATQEELLAEHYYPVNTPCGSALCRVVTSSPVGEYERIHNVFFQALACARSRVEAITPYFIPDSAMQTALRAAVQRGVHIDVTIPGVGDSPFVQRAMFGTLPELMSWGINVFVRKAPFVHAKAFTMDGAWAMVGSANLDARSFRFNDECNLEVMDTAFVEVLNAALKAERGESHHFSAEEWSRRPLGTRLSERAAALFGPTL